MPDITVATGMVRGPWMWMIGSASAISLLVDPHVNLQYTIQRTFTF